MTATGLVCIGRSSGAFGLKGELRVFSYAEDPRLYTRAGKVLIGAEPQTCRPYRVVSLRPHGQRLLLTLEGLSSREEADRLKGLWIYIEQDALPPPGDDEYYWHQAQGARVFHRDGWELGELIQVSNAGAHDLWLIRGAGGREALFPVVGQFLVELDLEARRIVVDPPQGLLSAQGFWDDEEGVPGPES